MMGKNAFVYKKMPGGIRGRSLCISRGQTRYADRRNRDSDRSPARYMAARSRTAVKNVHRRFGQRSQNCPRRSGSNPNLADFVDDKRRQEWTRSFSLENIMPT